MRRQIVIGDAKSGGPPYPEDRWPDARIGKRALLAAIRDLQERVLALELEREQPTEEASD